LARVTSNCNVFLFEVTSPALKKAQANNVHYPAASQ